ncbi:MAG TPA: plastocyanin/azurin family copper-binding protein [Solirubrobacterales bacterium]|nr:plastocyanin/azurin family copper-binding protein [Solirubrobacterales bacterium]
MSVRFGLVAVVLAAILLGGLAARTTVSSGEASGTVGAECGWERHSKRVVKRVKRHGKVRKVVRWRRWWTCAPPATASPIATAPASAPPPTPAPEPEPEANRLSVKGVEYYFVLSRPSVKAGEVTIELNNQGEDPHNLNIRTEGSDAEPLQIPETDSLQRSVATFDLPAGQYRLWCSLPEHEERGMAASLTVG